MRSFVFFNGLFYKVLFFALFISVAAKTIINFRIDPINSTVSLPSGRFAITHAEHRQEVWPDYCDGLFGGISCKISDFIEPVVGIDNLETIVFIALVALVVVPVSLFTIGQDRSGLIPKYVGMGLIFAGGISNEGEIALLNHATDFLYFRVDIFSYHRFFIANLADTMILVGFLLVIVTPTYQKSVAALATAGPPFRSELESESDQP
jgi:hypothetical protein